MTQFAEPHWTDDATRRPIFDTVIDARGPRGNVYVIIGTAISRLKAIAVPEDRIVALREAALNAGSYEEAVDHVERWFRVRRDER